MGEDAKQRLKDLILDKTINFENLGKDNFGRTLGYVYFNKLFINEILIEEELAYYVKSKTPTPNSLIIEKAEEKAKVSGRGVWSSLCQTQKEGCLIKGNYRISEHTRIYHTPDCFNYARIVIKPGTSDRWFCTESEATAAGFKKSLDCPK